MIWNFYDLNARDAILLTFNIIRDYSIFTGFWYGSYGAFVV